MKIKAGATIAGISREIRPVLSIADRIWTDHGEELVVTEGLANGGHSAGSYHYTGDALDFRTRYFTDAEQHNIASELTDAIRNKLGQGYRVILHSTHLHVAYTG